MFLEMSPYIILGLIFVALLNFFVTKDMIAKQIGSESFLSILKASLFGIPLPLCSCGVVPTAVYMSKNGGSKSATVSFLISTPQTGIDSLIATYGMMGPLFAIFRPLSALVTGIIGGLAVKFFNRDLQPVNSKPKFIGLNQFSAKPLSKTNNVKLTEKIKKTLNYSFVEFLDDITSQFILGVLISGLISYFIPNDYFADSGMNNGIGGMIIMIIIGIPMYVCATASIPIAMTLIMKGFSPGVAFVFLAAGPATNAASITIISKALGKKVVLIYLVTIALFSILMGYLLDFIYDNSNPDIIWHNHQSHNHNDMFLNEEMKIVIGIIFFVMILSSIYRKYFRKYFNHTSLEKENDLASGFSKIKIEGMTCNHCVATVSKTISDFPGVNDFKVSLEENAAYIKGTINLEKFKNEIENIGYKVKD